MGRQQLLLLPLVSPPLLIHLLLSLLHLLRAKHEETNAHVRLSPSSVLGDFELVHTLRAVFVCSSPCASVRLHAVRFQKLRLAPGSRGVGGRLCVLRRVFRCANPMQCEDDLARTLRNLLGIRVAVRAPLSHQPVLVRCVCAPTNCAVRPCIVTAWLPCGGGFRRSVDSGVHLAGSGTVLEQGGFASELPHLRFEGVLLDFVATSIVRRYKVFHVDTVMFF